MTGLDAAGKVLFVLRYDSSQRLEIRRFDVRGPVVVRRVPAEYAPTTAEGWSAFALTAWRVLNDPSVT